MSPNEYSAQCNPNILHYRNNKPAGKMECFVRAPLWSDDWAVTTKDAKWSAQFEHTLHITIDRAEALTVKIETSPV